MTELTMKIGTHLFDQSINKSIEDNMFNLIDSRVKEYYLYIQRFFEQMKIAAVAEDLEPIFYYSHVQVIK
jgi:hypothetical protein